MAAARHFAGLARTSARLSSQARFQRSPFLSSPSPSSAFSFSGTGAKRTFFWGSSSPKPTPDQSVLDASPVADAVRASASAGATEPASSATEAAAAAVTNTTTTASTAAADAAAAAVASTPAPLPDFTGLGYLHSIGLEYGPFHPSAYAEWLLEHVHLWTAAPGPGCWAASIALATLAVRLALVPVAVHSLRTAERMQQSAQLTKPLTDALVQAYVSKDNALVAQRTKELQLFRKANNMPNPLKMFYNVFVQAAVGYGGFRLLYDMANLPVPGLEAGGYGWFMNIAASDPSYILPVATWALMSGGMQISRKLMPVPNASPQAQQAALLTKFVPLIAGVSSAYFPGTVQIFIFTSAAFQSVFQVLSSIPRVRQLMGLSRRPSGAPPPIM